jgi:hypothetical protein
VGKGREEFSSSCFRAWTRISLTLAILGRFLTICCVNVIYVVDVSTAGKILHWAKSWRR